MRACRHRKNFTGNVDDCRNGCLFLVILVPVVVVLDAVVAAAAAESSSSGCLLSVILAVSLNNHPSKKKNTELDHAKPQGFDVDKCFDVTYPEAQ